MKNPFLTQPSPVDLGAADEWDFVTLFLSGGCATGRRVYTDSTTIVLHDCHITGLGSTFGFVVSKIAFNLEHIVGMTPSLPVAPLSPKGV